MEPQFVNAIEIAAVILGPGGAVFIAMKGAMNGLKEINKEQLKLLREMRDDIKVVKHDVDRYTPGP